jgi:hypothetical protein
VDQASSPATPTLPAHCRLARIGQRGHVGEGGRDPCFGRLGQKAMVGRTASAGWAGCTMGRAQLHCAVYYFPSELFKSIQFKFKSGLNFENS